MTPGDYVIVKAGELLPGQKFETIHTGTRGVVQEMSKCVDGEAAPRVLMVTCDGYVISRVLHPNVYVKAQLLSSADRAFFGQIDRV